MQRVLFDSSFLMAVAEHPTPWETDIAAALGGFEPVILECVRGELEAIEGGGGKRGRLAGLALRLAQGFKPLPSGEAGADEELASAALAEGSAVATVDGELTRSLKALGVRVVGLRSRRASVV